MVRTCVDWILLNPSAATVTPLAPLPRSDHFAITIDAAPTKIAPASATAKTLSKSDAAHPTNGTSDAASTAATTATSRSCRSSSGSSESVFTPVIQAATVTKHQLLALLSWIGDSIAALFRPRDEGNNITTTSNLHHHQSDNAKSNTTEYNDDDDDHDDRAASIIQDNTHNKNGESLNSDSLRLDHIVLVVDSVSQSESDTKLDSQSDSNSEVDNVEDESNDCHTSSTVAVVAQETARAADPTSASIVPAPSTTHANAHKHTQDIACVGSITAAAAALAPIPTPNEAAPQQEQKTITLSTFKTAMATTAMANKTTTVAPTNSISSISFTSTSTVASTSTNTITTSNDNSPQLHNAAKVTPTHTATPTEKAKAFIAHAQAHSVTPIRLVHLKLDHQMHGCGQVDSSSVIARACSGTGTGRGTCTSIGPCTCTRNRHVDCLPAPAPAVSPNSLLRQYVCDCYECPFVSTITEHVALAYALSRGCEFEVDIHTGAAATTTNNGANDAPLTLAESVLVWRILRALAVYNETRAPRRTDVSVVTRMLRRCTNVSERAFECLVDSGCFDA